MKKTKEIKNTKELKRVVSSHLSRSQDQNAPIDQRFESLWKALNVYGTFFSKEKMDRDMLKWIIEKSQFSFIFKSCYNQDATFRKNLNELKALTPIYDMRPGINKAVTIYDVTSPSQVIDAIYQVRCNLIHGQKPMDNPRNRLLVKFSFPILEEIVPPMIASLK